MTRPPAPVSERTPLAPARSPCAAARCRGSAARARAPPPPTYTVKRGDTLAQIALDNGLDYRDLAAWNAIENPNVIRVGQVLVLAAPGSAAPSPGSAVTTPLVTAPPIAPKSAGSRPARRQHGAAVGARQYADVQGRAEGAEASLFGTGARADAGRACHAPAAAPPAPRRCGGSCATAGGCALRRPRRLRHCHRAPKPPAFPKSTTTRSSGYGRPAAK